ncbi:L-threonylcarbamoyladenylate synthase [Desulfovibrio sp. ZJ369]|uniref:L-threonylcarbamoyladenylate synthase n=1 Tax=Desulfovibrio sp. ZJ369 TaxID=2709793 RepID=UPI0013EC4742|nr:L-threonylcarbamoyladenylate synthase [Desulfovibrio sp. ZJ369]
MSHSPCRVLDPEAAALCLRRGGVLIFPTETFYGLGCLAADGGAVARIYQLKRRPVQQPLPLLAADVAQAKAVARLEAAPPELLAAFWPGPLTVLLPARAADVAQGGARGLPAALLNGEGKVAVRVTPHSLAARLALLAGGALTASSANPSGRAPACHWKELDPELLAALADLGDLGGLLPAGRGGEQPAGGAPSTLVEPLEDAERGGQKRLRLLRAGAISSQALERAGFACV